MNGAPLSPELGALELPPTRSEVATRVREFLALTDDFSDEESMWMTGGLVLTWGDLRVLADYARTSGV